MKIINIVFVAFFCLVCLVLSGGCSQQKQSEIDIPRSVQGIYLCSSKDSVVNCLKKKGYKYEILSKEHIYVDLEHSLYEGISLNLYFVEDMCFGMSYQPTKDRSQFDNMAIELKKQYPMHDEHKGIGENGDAVLYSYNNGQTKIILRTDFGAICYYDIKLDSVYRQLHPNDY